MTELQTNQWYPMLQRGTLITALGDHGSFQSLEDGNAYIKDRVEKASDTIKEKARVWTLVYLREDTTTRCEAEPPVPTLYFIERFDRNLFDRILLTTHYPTHVDAEAQTKYWNKGLTDRYFYQVKPVKFPN